MVGRCKFSNPISTTYSPHFSRALYVCGLYLYPTLVLDNPKIGGIVESIILFHDFRAELDF